MVKITKFMHHNVSVLKRLFISQEVIRRLHLYLFCCLCNQYWAPTAGNRISAVQGWTLSVWYSRYCSLDLQINAVQEQKQVPRKHTGLLLSRLSWLCYRNRATTWSVDWVQVVFTSELMVPSFLQFRIFTVQNLKSLHNSRLQYRLLMMSL